MLFENFWKEANDNKNKDELLFEGLTRTYDINIFYSGLIKKLKINPHNISILPLNKVNIVNTTNIDLDELKQYIGQCGYFISDNNDRGLFLEPLYPSLDKNIPSEVYHISPIIYKNSILEIGLCPKNSKTLFDHPANRIYLFVSLTKNYQDVLDFSGLLIDNIFNTERMKQIEFKPEVDIDRKSKEVSVFKIKTNKNTVKYYLDPNLIIGDISNTCYAVFTHINIPPSDITFLQDVEIS